MFINYNMLIKLWQTTVCIAGIAIFFIWLLMNTKMMKAISAITIVSFLVYLIYRNQNILLKGVLKLGF